MATNLLPGHSSFKDNRRPNWGLCRYYIYIRVVNSSGNNLLILFMVKLWSCFLKIPQKTNRFQLKSTNWSLANLYCWPRCFSLPITIHIISASIFSIWAHSHFKAYYSNPQYVLDNSRWHEEFRWSIAGSIFVRFSLITIQVTCFFLSYDVRAG